jgi:hypothetical protein
MMSRKRKEMESLMGKSLKIILDQTKTRGFSGRCWGTGESPLKGSHVTLGKNGEVVSVHLGADGKLQILEYRLSSDTVLGETIHQILVAAGLPVA